MEVVREIVFPASPEEVWEALTEPEQLEEWFANDVELEAPPGGAGGLRWGDGGARRAACGRRRGRARAAARPRLGRRRRGRVHARGGAGGDAAPRARDGALAGV